MRKVRTREERYDPGGGGLDPRARRRGGGVLPCGRYHRAGAGSDAFLGAMVWGLANGRKTEEAFAYGVAAGAATAMTPGTELGRRAQIEQLYARMSA